MTGPATRQLPAVRRLAIIAGASWALVLTGTATTTAMAVVVFVRGWVLPGVLILTLTVAGYLLTARAARAQTQRWAVERAMDRHPSARRRPDALDVELAALLQRPAQ